MDALTTQLLSLATAFSPCDDAVVRHRENLLNLLAQTAAPFSRHQYEPGHVTASAFVLSPDRTSLLLIHHRKLQGWLQPGGHIEAGDLDLQLAAAREACEETGVRDLTPLHCGLVDIDIHAIPAHGDAPAHQHFDTRFVFQAGTTALRPQQAEVSAVQWVPIEALTEFTQELSVLRTVERLLALTRAVHD